MLTITKAGTLFWGGLVLDRLLVVAVNSPLCIQELSLPSIFVVVEYFKVQNMFADIIWRSIPGHFGRYIQDLKMLLRNH